MLPRMAEDRPSNQVPRHVYCCFGTNTLDHACFTCAGDAAQLQNVVVEKIGPAYGKPIHCPPAQLACVNRGRCGRLVDLDLAGRVLTRPFGPVSNGGGDGLALQLDDSWNSTPRVLLRDSTLLHLAEPWKRVVCACSRQCCLACADTRRDRRKSKKRGPSCLLACAVLSHPIPYLPSRRTLLSRPTY